MLPFGKHSHILSPLWKIFFLVTFTFRQVLEELVTEELPTELRLGNMTQGELVTTGGCSRSVYPSRGQ